MKLIISYLAFFVIANFFSATKFYAQNKIRLIEVDRKLDSTEVVKSRISFKTENEIRKNWSKLRKGMNAENVLILLGNPKSESVAVDGSLLFWKYKRGELVFDGVSKTLSRWDK
jgi:hypothetical protein